MLEKATLAFSTRYKCVGAFCCEICKNLIKKKVAGVFGEINARQAHTLTKLSLRGVLTDAKGPRILSSTSTKNSRRRQRISASLHNTWVKAEKAETQD